MTSTDVLAVVDAYHRAWTGKRFEEAVALLASDLTVEVPMNDYPTTESFAAALARFGNEVTSVEVLSKLGDADQAMILYDMDVRSIGTIRVVEHFTVKNDKIVRLRQIHDTSAFRDSGPATEQQPSTQHPPAGALPQAGYTAALEIEAPPDAVFAALTSLQGLTGWWATTATGAATAGNTFTLSFAGLDETIEMHVDSAQAPTSVRWTCLVHTGLPDWRGTTLTFDLEPQADGSTTLRFHHLGLVPQLECYDQCRAGWEHFLPSLRSYVETGSGTPFAGRHS